MGRGEIPQAIAHDRPSDLAGDVIHLAERAGRHDALFLESQCQVVGLEFLACPTDKESPTRRVAAGLGHEVHDEATCFGLTQPARTGKGDLFGGASVHNIAGRRIADRCTSDGEAVDGQPPLVAPATMDGKLRR